MRIVWVGLVVFLVLLLTAACVSGGAPPEEHRSDGSVPVKITLWSLETKDHRLTILQESIRAFNEANHDIQIVPYYYESEAYKNKLRVAMVSGKMPDLFHYWTGENFKRMVDSGVVGDLSRLLQENPDFKNQFVPEALQSAAYHDRIYGIPYAVNHVLIWYNRHIFESHGLKPPARWEEFLDIVQTLSDQGITPVAVAGKERWPLLHWFAYLSHRSGGEEPFERVMNRKGDFSDPSFVEAGVRFHELVKKKAFPPAFLGMDLADAERMFLESKAAMYMQGDWVAGKLLDHNAPLNDIGYFRFPTIDGKGDPSEYYGGYSTGWAISSTANTQAAFKVLSYLMSRDQRKMFVEYSGSIPPIQGLSISKLDTSEAVYDFVQFIKADPTGYFGFYDQMIDPSRAQQLLDAVVTFAGEEEMSRQDIEAVLSQIR